MNGKFYQFEPWLYFGAFILAIAFRFINLGAIPLGDREASEAIKALEVIQHASSGSGQSLYTLLTAALFAIFESSNFLARLFPVLMGCLLLILPLYLRDDLGRIPAIILTYGLALDPAMVAFSRQAGSIMPSLCFILLSLTLLWKHHERPAGIFAGLAVLSGTSFWFGLTGFLLVLLTKTLLINHGRGNPQPTSGDTDSILHSAKGKEGLIAFVLTIVLGGVLSLILPTGINIIGSSLIDYFHGWYTSNGISIQRVVITMVVYQVGIIILGLIEGIQGWIHRAPFPRNVLITCLIFFALLILYPGRQVDYIAWVVVLFWVLAAWSLGKLVHIPREIVLPVFGHSILVGALIVFLILNLTWVLGGFGGLDVAHSGAILASVVVIALISILIAYGWGVDVATRGVVGGISLIALMVMLSLTISAGSVNARSVPDLLRQDQRVTGAVVLQNDLDTISKWATGEKYSLSIDVVNFNHPSIHWLLRYYQTTRYLETPVPGEVPEIILSDFSISPELTGSYRGETFAWQTQTEWDKVDAFTLVDWVLHRKVYESPINLILWVRQDLFVTSTQSTAHPMDAQEYD